MLGAPGSLLGAPWPLTVIGWLPWTSTTKTSYSRAFGFKGHQITEFGTLRPHFGDTLDADA